MKRKDLDFPRNRFSVTSSPDRKKWLVMEGKKILSEHEKYDEAEQVWSIYCSTICIDALSVK